MKKLALLLAVLGTMSCGYHLVGTGGSLPATIRRIQVPMFTNMTTRFELDVKLTQAVISEIVARGRVDITTDPEKADAILTGRILTFTASPIAFSDQKTADRYDISIVAEITLKETKSGTVIFSNPTYQYRTDYQVPQGQDFESAQSAALDALSQLFARSLIVAILEGF